MKRNVYCSRSREGLPANADRLKGNFQIKVAIEFQIISTPTIDSYEQT